MGSIVPLFQLVKNKKCKFFWNHFGFSGGGGGSTADPMFGKGVRRPNIRRHVVRPGVDGLHVIHFSPLGLDVIHFVSAGSQ